MNIFTCIIADKAVKTPETNLSCSDKNVTSNIYILHKLNPTPYKVLINLCISSKWVYNSIYPGKSNKT